MGFVSIPILWLVVAFLVVCFVLVRRRRSPLYVNDDLPRIVNVLNVVAWLLLVFAVFAFLDALFRPEAYKSLPESALPAGLLLVLAGHLFTQSKTIAENVEKQSAFYLEGFRKAFDRAQSLLADGNNKRVVWIEAARHLSLGQKLADGVTVAAHERVLELERLRYRGVFHEVLDQPAAFFYGVSPVPSTLEEAAKASTATEVKDGRTNVSPLHVLAEASIRQVWLAASWPDDYKDPVGSRFRTEELGRFPLLNRGLHEFLEHTRAWHSAAGILHPRTDL